MGKKSSWVGRDELSFVSVLINIENTLRSQCAPSIDWPMAVLSSDPSRAQGLGREIYLFFENVCQRSSLICTWHLVSAQSFLLTVSFSRVLLYVVYLSKLSVFFTCLTKLQNSKTAEEWSWGTVTSPLQPPRWPLVSQSSNDRKLMMSTCIDSHSSWEVILLSSWTPEYLPIASMKWFSLPEHHRTRPIKPYF